MTQTLADFLIALQREIASGTRVVFVEMEPAMVVRLAPPVLKTVEFVQLPLLSPLLLPVNHLHLPVVMYPIVVVDQIHHIRIVSRVKSMLKAIVPGLTTGMPDQAVMTDQVAHILPPLPLLHLHPLQHQIQPVLLISLL